MSRRFWYLTAVWAVLWALITVWGVVTFLLHQPGLAVVAGLALNGALQPLIQHWVPYDEVDA